MKHSKVEMETYARQEPQYRKLFEVIFSKGSYSSYREYSKIFAGNTADKVWEYVKIFAKEGCLKDDACYLTDVFGIKYKGNRYQFDVPKYRREIDWNDEDDIFSRVEIKRLSVVYVKT